MGKDLARSVWTVEPIAEKKGWPVYDRDPVSRRRLIPRHGVHWAEKGTTSDCTYNKKRFLGLDNVIYELSIEEVEQGLHDRCTSYRRQYRPCMPGIAVLKLEL